MNKPCEAHKIKASQNLHKIISTHLLLERHDFCLVLSDAVEPYLLGFAAFLLFIWECQNVSKEFRMV